MFGVNKLHFHVKLLVLIEIEMSCLGRKMLSLDGNIWYDFFESWSVRENLSGGLTVLCGLYCVGCVSWNSDDQSCCTRYGVRHSWPCYTGLTESVFWKIIVLRSGKMIESVWSFCSKLIFWCFVVKFFEMGDSWCHNRLLTKRECKYYGCGRVQKPVLFRFPELINLLIL